MIRAAGGVLWRHGAQGREVAVVHRPRYDDWSLPKGKLDAGEPHLLGAVREVREETGRACTAGTSLGTTSYDVGGTPKTVRWWALRAGDGEFAPNDEVDEVRWLRTDDALALVRESEPLQRWARLPADAAVVLLVRHASAGDPHEWRGPDDARPLDAKGAQQAAHIAQVLSAYRPVRIVCAPPVRCRDTIAPLASSVGLRVEFDAAVGEVGARADPERHVVGLAVSGETVVVCSQGGVIPRVVEALAPERAPARARKGSVWAVTVSSGRAVVTDDDVLS